jgi:hypothetical protein
MDFLSCVVARWWALGSVGFLLFAVTPQVLLCPSDMFAAASVFLGKVRRARLFVVFYSMHSCSSRDLLLAFKATRRVASSFYVGSCAKHKNDDDKLIFSCSQVH